MRPYVLGLVVLGALGAGGYLLGGKRGAVAAVTLGAVGSYVFQRAARERLDQARAALLTQQPQGVPT